jgi:hypothetical protein
MQLRGLKDPSGSDGFRARPVNQTVFTCPGGVPPMIETVGSSTIQFARTLLYSAPGFKFHSMIAA